MIRYLTDNITAGLNATTASSDVEEAASLQWHSLLAVVALLIMSAFCNGNNIGVLGMDESYLELLTKGPFETKKEQKEAYLASVLLPLR
jgi:hypothetical protein